MASFVGIWPVPSCTSISSPYGYRSCPFHGYEFHGGIDIPGGMGTRIVAAADGAVVSAIYDGGYGNRVIISHGNGWQTLYAHCGSFAKYAGAGVKAGDTIAYVGSTGNSTGAHCHFEVRKDGNKKSPLDYVSRNATASNTTTTGSSSGGSGSSSGSSGSSGGGLAAAAAPKKVDVSKVDTKYTVGKVGVRKTSLRDEKNVQNSGVELLTEDTSGALVQLRPCDDLTVEWERKGVPGILRFTLPRDSNVKMEEGRPVRFRYNNKKMFFGYLFEQSHSDARTITWTAYDQLRYFKSKETMVYKKKSYSQLVRDVCSRWYLSCGTVADTKHTIQARVEEGTVFDILGNASDETTLKKGTLFVLYDNFGKICLSNIQDMKLPVLISVDTAGKYQYSAGIDKETYTRIKLATDNDKTGVRELYIANDEGKQRKWGKLQYYENVSGASAALLKEKAKLLLKVYAQKNRSLSVSDVFGDCRVRGGSSVVVKMNLGDTALQHYMVVEKVKHRFRHGEHFMDLSLAGGGTFSA